MKAMCNFSSSQLFSSLSFHDDRDVGDGGFGAVEKIYHYWSVLNVLSKDFVQFAKRTRNLVNFSLVGCIILFCILAFPKMHFLVRQVRHVYRRE